MMASRAPSLAAKAETMAASGRVPEAVLALNQLAARGDADALFTLGMWRLAGQFVPLDLGAARDLFRRAGEAGRTDAAIIHTNFLASGVGGAPDWKAAMARLEALARTDARSKAQLKLIRKMELTEDGAPLAMPKGELCSPSPHVERFPGLLTPAECDYLAAAAAPMLKPSLVVDERSGRQVPHPIRSSDGAIFSWLLANPAVHALNRRMAAASATHVDQGEPLQILRYRPGQQYKAHYDALAGLKNQRIMTLLVYLNDDYRGGETRFLKAGLSLKGRKGEGLLFRNTLADGRPDPMSEHAGLPVTAGVKLIASRWIRAEPFVPPG